MESRKKIIIIIIAIVLLFVAFFGFKQIKNRSLFQKTDLYSVVSSRAVVIVETKNLMDFSKSLLYENDYWILTDKIGFLTDFNNLLDKIDFLFTKNKALQEIANRQALIVYNISSADSIQTLHELMVIKSTKDEAENYINYISDNIYPAQKTETIKYKSTKIYLLTDGADTKFVCSYIEGMLLLSPNLEEVQKAIELADGKISLKDNKFFMNVKETSGKNALANIFINVKKLSPFIINKINLEYPMLRNGLSTFTDWIGLDISISTNRLLVNGYSNVKSEYFTSVFQGQEPVETNLYKYLPFNTCFFSLYGISDYSLFKDKLGKEKTDIVSEMGSARTDRFVSEHFAGQLAVGSVGTEKSLKGNSFVLLSIKDSTLAAEQLDVLAKKTTKILPDTSLKITIYALPSSFHLSASFGDFVKLDSPEYLSIIGNKILITSSSDLLVKLTDEITAGYTLDKNNTFKLTQESYDTKSTVLSYIYFPSLIKYANEIFEDSLANKLIKNKDLFAEVQSIGSQMENERGMIYHNAFFKYGKIENETSPEKKTNRLIWEIKFDSNPVFGPVVVENTMTGADEIFIQDKNNKLYFYTHEGKKQWSVQLEAPIMGNEMAQIDYYKNKKYQFVFNTAKKIYIIDRKGKLVENYPVKLSSLATAPIAVFDYENNMDYRFAIPCENKKIYIYKKEGTVVPDWVFQQTQGLIKNSIQHFRVSNKDYLLVNDGVKAYILDRRGSERIKLQSDFQISKNNIFYQQQSKESTIFLITDKQGYLKRIGLDGTVRSLKVSDTLSENHHFIATQVSKPIVYIYVDGNKISVNNQDMKCMFVKHTEDKNLIPILSNNQLAVYSATSNNVFVFDLKQLDVKEQTFVSKSMPYLGELKPMPNNYLIVYNNGKLSCYELN